MIPNTLFSSGTDTESTSPPVFLCVNRRHLFHHNHHPSSMVISHGSDARRALNPVASSHRQVRTRCTARWKGIETHLAPYSSMKSSFSRVYLSKMGALISRGGASFFTSGLVATMRSPIAAGRILLLRRATTGAAALPSWVARAALAFAVNRRAPDGANAMVPRSDMRTHVDTTTATDADLPSQAILVSLTHKPEWRALLGDSELRLGACFQLCSEAPRKHTTGTVYKKLAGFNPRPSRQQCREECYTLKLTTAPIRIEATSHISLTHATKCRGCLRHVHRVQSDGEVFPGNLGGGAGAAYLCITLRSGNLLVRHSLPCLWKRPCSRPWVSIF